MYPSFVYASNCLCSAVKFFSAKDWRGIEQNFSNFIFVLVVMYEHYGLLGWNTLPFCYDGVIHTLRTLCLWPFYPYFFLLAHKCHSKLWNTSDVNGFLTSLCSLSFIMGLKPLILTCYLEHLDVFHHEHTFCVFSHKGMSSFYPTVLHDVLNNLKSFLKTVFIWPPIRPKYYIIYFYPHNVMFIVLLCLAYQPLNWCAGLKVNIKAAESNIIVPKQICPGLDWIWDQFWLLVFCTDLVDFQKSSALLHFMCSFCFCFCFFWFSCSWWFHTGEG